jgi:hypothetical protein
LRLIDDVSSRYHISAAERVAVTANGFDRHDAITIAQTSTRPTAMMANPRDSGPGRVGDTNRFAA